MSLLHSLITPFLKLYFNYKSNNSLPKIDGEMHVYGLRESVIVNRDKYGVPHIQAKNQHDLFFAQGFVHAQDRLWQMELNRRIASGTLSEMLGEVTIETDKLSRTLGFRRLGEADWENQSEEVQDAIKAYVKGINAFINHLDTNFPLEFGLQKFKPANWTKEDCLAVSRLMIWQLSHAWYGESIRSQLIDAVGEEHASELEIQYRKDNPIQLPEGIEFNKLTKGGSLKKVKGPFLKNNMGSNAWVISKERSVTGSPILANDMHLSLTLPGIWYHNSLRGKEINSTGVSIPGLPLVLVGHNNDIAWGATLSYNDVEDLVVEKFNPENKDEYKFKDSWKEAEKLPEIIKVKDGINVQHIIRITHHGPIISDFLNSQETLALQSKSLQPLQSMSGWYKLNLASDWDEFVSAIQLIEAPSLNIVYADSDNIGYYNSGRVPIRAKGDGRLPVPGWTGKYEWKGEIPFEEMPHALNPEKGYFITCNNKVISDDYAHHLGENFMNGFRAKRLEQYFEENEKIDFELCKKMQMDHVSTAAPIFLEHYKELEIDDPNPGVKKAFQLMMEWDYELKTDTVGGALYEVTRYMAIRLVLEKHLGEELTSTYMGDGFHPVLLPSHEFYSQDIVVLLRLLEADEESWWIKHAGGKEKLLISAFKRAFEWLMTNIGSNVDKWTWGKINTVTFDHAFAVKEPLGKIFSRGPISIGGDSDTPNQSSMAAESYGIDAWAPTWRQIIDLGDITRSIAMHAPGQSGHLASPHYDDLIEMWKSGEYFTLLWTRGQIENNLEGQLNLEPQVK